MIRRSAKEWQHLIDSQEASDMTIAEFCQSHQINQSTFYLQRKKLSELALPQGNSHCILLNFTDINGWPIFFQTIGDQTGH